MSPAGRPILRGTTRAIGRPPGGRWCNVRHIEDTLADIRRRFDRGAEQFPYLKVAVTSLRLTYAWKLAEFLFCGDGVVGWSSTRGRQWAQFYFDERVSSHWRSRQLELRLVDSPAEPNLGEGIATFQRVAADAMHVARTLPGCPIDSSDECGWLELLFTTAWTHPAGATLRAGMQYPLVEMVRALAKCEDVKLTEDNQGKFEKEAESILSDGDFISFLSPFRDSVAMIDLLAAGDLAGSDVDRVAGQQATVTSRSRQKQGPLRPFTGGEMVFFEDRVELCGVDISSGPRSQTRRRILDLLRNKQKDGTFVAYSGDAVARKLKLIGGQGAVAGAIRDLRDVIIEALRNEANLTCGRKDIILGGGRGYRLAESVSVHFAGQKGNVDITVTESGGNDGNHGNGGNDRSDRVGNAEGRRA